MAEEIVQDIDLKDDMVPMICRVNRSQLIEVVNNCFQNQYHISPDAEVTVRVPGGGDWSNTDLEIDNKDTLIEIRWKRKGLP